MPFDPDYPQNGDDLNADPMRAQLNALHDEIAAIPAGPQGEPGETGPQGEQGPAGNPGEVSLAQLNEAIAGTARNPTGVLPLTLTVSDPPTQAEVQEVVDKVNEMIGALFRAPV